MEEMSVLNERTQQIRQCICDHVASRLHRAIEKWNGKTDSAAKDKIKKAHEKYQLRSILFKGAQAAGGITIASHIAKGIHPDLKVKEVSNLTVNFSQMSSLDLLGSHILPVECSLLDTTGDGAYNNAAYELYLLLDCKWQNETLGSLLAKGDEDAISAFLFNNEFSENDVESWLNLLQNKCTLPVANTKEKQVYWLCNSDNPLVDSDYELLVPLYPASLVHQVYLKIQDHRFSEANKGARQAYYARKAYDGVFHHYPDLAVQKMGGTKPHNISQLNSERGGNNYLLASLPPPMELGQTRTLRLPINDASVFDRVFPARLQVRKTLRQLHQFLASNPKPNQDTRQRRQAYIDTLIDELVCLAGELLQNLPAGWTSEGGDEQKRFQNLHRTEQLWLDPLRAKLPQEQLFAQEWLFMDWPAEVGKRFANWLNHALRNQLPFGDVEARQWQKALLVDEGGFKQQLRALRQQLDAPHHIPIRKTHEETL